MYILGYSGINALGHYRNNAFAQLSPVEQKFIQGMDSAACLINNGVIIAAAEEERFIDQKHTSNFPVNSINYCLAEAGISINDIDTICHGFDYEKYAKIYAQDEYNNGLYQEILSPDAQVRTIKKFFPEWCSADKFRAIEHHSAHAASAYFQDTQAESLIVVADAMGEIDSLSIFSGKNGKITQIASFDLLSSIGMFYSLVTVYLGFSPNEDEYKVMGLAPYGDPLKYKNEFSAFVILEDDGEIIIPSLLDGTSHLERQTYKSFMRQLADVFGDPRAPGSEITQHHQDIAAGLQACLNEVMLHILKYWQNITGLKNLCMAGGVALNCVANSKIAESGLFDNIYIQPAAGDAGTSLGAALYYYYHHTNEINSASTYKQSERTLPLYGPDCSTFKPEDLARDLLSSINVVQLDRETLLEQVASAIIDNKVIAWMSGRMEFGPRALGNRSILANPMDAKMRDRVNAIVKKRESFRPFAPSVKRELADEYFDLYEGCDYSTMLMTCLVKERYREILPAVTHVDGTARIQTVDRSCHLKYWEIIDKFELISGLPILLNTSFNVKGQAMVCTPLQGINTFLRTEIDLLVINDYMISKR